MLTPSEIGQEVTMSRTFLRNTGQFFDSPQHHKGEIVDISSSGKVATVVWPFEPPVTVLLVNLVLWDRRHLEPK